MSKPQVTFITKEEGCSLCDDAFVEIESAMDYAEFDLDIVKIRKGDEYYEKYWDKIPVILINGKLAFKYRTSRDQFLRALEGRKWWKIW
jgi:hypothetical protein